MRLSIIASLFLLLGSMTMQAQNQTNPSASAAKSPDKGWVLKDYPNATDIRWHKEKNGQTEFEFMNDQKETKVWYNEAGEVVKTKVETAENGRKKESHHVEKSEGDDDDDDDHKQ